MARIRTIKPEFFTSEDIVSLSPLARLLYIAIWCEADKEARLVWKPNTFKLRYLPGDNCDIEELCQQLINSGLVVLYGEGYAQVPSFKAHQHINPREGGSQLPDPESYKSTREARVGTRRARVGTGANLDIHAQVGREGKGREGIDSPEPVPDSEPLTMFSIPLNDKTEYRVPVKDFGEWNEIFPAVDVAQELREMRAWSNANPTKRKTRTGVSKFIVAWLAKAQDTPSRSKQQPADWTQAAL